MKHTNKTLYIVITLLILAIVALIVQNQIVLKKTQIQTEKIEKPTNYPNLDRIKESMDFEKRHDTVFKRVESICKYDISARKGKNSYLWLLMVYYAKCNMIKILVPLENFHRATPPASIERQRRELYKKAKSGDIKYKWLLEDKEFLEEMNHEEELCHDYYQKNKLSEQAMIIK